MESLVPLGVEVVFNLARDVITSTFGVVEVLVVPDPSTLSGSSGYRPQFPLYLSRRFDTISLSVLLRMSSITAKLDGKVKQLK